MLSSVVISAAVAVVSVSGWISVAVNKQEEGGHVWDKSIRPNIRDVPSNTEQLATLTTTNLCGGCYSASPVVCLNFTNRCL